MPNSKELSQLKKMNEKFQRGDSITNKELNLLIEMYTALDTGLSILGTEFWLARKETNSRLELLESFRRARDE